MSYKDLQKEAKALGLKYVGVSASELERTIVQAKAKTPAKFSTEAPKPKVNKKINAAIVREGSNEIRRYTFDIHGDNFAELADEFATAHEYEVELVEVKSGALCPNCGATVST